MMTSGLTLRFPDARPPASRQPAGCDRCLIPRVCTPAAVSKLLTEPASAPPPGLRQRSPRPGIIAERPGERKRALLAA